MPWTCRRCALDWGKAKEQTPRELVIYLPSEINYKHLESLWDSSESEGEPGKQKEAKTVHKPLFLILCKAFIYYKRDNLLLICSFSLKSWSRAIHRAQWEEGFDSPFIFHIPISALGWTYFSPNSKVWSMFLVEKLKWAALSFSASVMSHHYLPPLRELQKAQQGRESLRK